MDKFYLNIHYLTEDSPIVFTKEDKALAVYKIHPSKPGLMKPEKMFPLNIVRREGNWKSINYIIQRKSLSIQDEQYSLAIGFFDGLHKGHQTVIEEAKEKAEELGIRSAVMTFNPHPSHLFGDGKNKVGYITHFRRKVRLLRSMGVDTVFVVTFDWELASLSPEQFVDIFIKELGVKHVTAGFDFTFGSKGAGTMEDMAAFIRRGIWNDNRWKSNG